MERELWLVALLIVARIVALSGEQVAVHGLGQDTESPLPTMAVTFWGATVVLWIVASLHGQAQFIGSTIWTGVVYAIAFGLYTAALAIGPVGSVSPWTNATIVLLWMIRPTGDVASFIGIAIFTGGAWLLARGRLTRATLMILVADGFLVAARLIDASHTQHPVFAYAASLYTSISLWMAVPVVLFAQGRPMVRLIGTRPGWSVAAALLNAASYLVLFSLLKWIPPTLVEAVSTLAGVGATLAGVILFQESQAARKVLASCLMTLGVSVLIMDHYHSLVFRLLVG